MEHQTLGRRVICPSEPAYYIADSEWKCKRKKVSNKGWSIAKEATFGSNQPNAHCTCNKFTNSLDSFTDLEFRIYVFLTNIYDDFFFNWQTVKKLFWTNKKFLSLVFFLFNFIRYFQFGLIEIPILNFTLYVLDWKVEDIVISFIFLKRGLTWKYLLNLSYL